MILGIDMGGTNTRIGLVGDNMQLAGPCSIYASRELVCADDPADALWEMILDYLSGAGTQPEAVEKISVGVPSCVCSDLRTIFCAPNLIRSDGTLVFDHFNLADALEKRSKRPVLVNRDVNNLLCYDLEKHHLQGITAACYIGTGVGAAVSIGGKILLGRDGLAMEIGHLSLLQGDRPCGCGKKGCIETEAAGSRFQQLCKEHYPGEAWEKIFQEHATDTIVREYVRSCAYLPAMLATIFNPSALVLGGGVVEADGFPKSFFEEAILDLAATTIRTKPPRFVYADHLPERGVIGAAMFAMSPGIIA
ncbi:MAG: ROK family protein [Lachnospiraceae bacterium]|nr:ROK family protein [Lachnospiraceae bacterium]